MEGLVGKVITQSENCNFLQKKEERKEKKEGKTDVICQRIYYQLKHHYTRIRILEVCKQIFKKAVLNFSVFIHIASRNVTYYAWIASNMYALGNTNSRIMILEILIHDLLDFEKRN